MKCLVNIFGIYFSLCLLMLGLHVCMCAMCLLGAVEGQTGVSDPLELKLQMILNHFVGAGISTF